jgi:DNA-binding FrmR family transcriptional regulator
MMEDHSHPEESVQTAEQQSEQQADSCHALNLDKDGKTVRKSHHSQEMKGNLISRLNRVEGQIRGIKGLIDKDTYCDDVLTQIAAAQSALNSVGKLLLEGHMKSCIVERIQAGEHEVVDELLVTVRKLMK